MQSEEKKYKYIFSVVMAVYNCEPFLRETLDSIVCQQLAGFFAFENGKKTERLLRFEEIVQVIMVDDGSKDASGAICDEYAAKYPNFTVIHKPNGGVASARNEGLKYVEGKYMNFLDSDDKFSNTALVTMYEFFEQHYDETDVITMPLEFFDAFTGPHWQNYKFGDKPCVVNLFDRYDTPLMFVNASFFKSEYKDKVFFDGRLVCGEDIKYICTILSEKMTMGLVPNCYYEYRRRSSGEESLVQTAKKKVGWYFDYLEHLTEWAVQFAKEKWGYVPHYYQNILVCDLQWRFRDDYEETAKALLGLEEYERYKQVLYAVLKHFDDKIILRQRMIWREHKSMMLTKKYGTLPERCVYHDDVRLRWGNTRFCWLSACYTKIDFVKLAEGNLLLEGYTTLIGTSPEDPVSMTLELWEADATEPTVIPCEAVERDVTTYRLDEPLLYGYSFRAKIPLESVENVKIRFVCHLGELRIVKKDIRYSAFCPANPQMYHSYYYKDGYLVQCHMRKMVLRKCTKAQKKQQEKLFRQELWTSKKVGAKKAIAARLLYRVAKLFKRKPIWIVSDRIERASDNGEAFSLYLKDHAKDVNSYFWILEDSPDYKRLKKAGLKILKPYSWRFKMKYLLADVLVSSQSEVAFRTPFQSYSHYYGDLVANQKFVFLQHGITEKDVSKFYNKYATNIDRFITAATPEQKFVQSLFYYSDDEVPLTGMARYDRLYSTDDKIILIAPTWRASTVGGIDQETGLRAPRSGVENSAYCRYYSALLSDPRLLEAARQYGYSIKFIVHPNMVAVMPFMQFGPGVEMFNSDVEYRDMMACGSMMLTDYSSLAFDFAYLRKPVLYFQFDAADFFGGQHTVKKGYYDYDKNGLGEVTTDIDTTVELLIDYMKHDCALKPLYRERIDSFFAFNDQDNCKRILENIREMLQK